MTRFFYNFFMLVTLAVGGPVLLSLLVTRPKRRKTVLQRLFAGLAPEARRAWKRENRQPTIWVHALSLGEVISAQTLVRELEKVYGRNRLVFSTSTLTGYETAAKDLEPFVRRVFYFPYDILFSVARAVRLVAPDLVVIVETDLWPNFMARLEQKAIPALLVNARLSNRSTAGYRRIPRLMIPLLSAFKMICAQSREDARRFITIGARPDRVQVTGNMKFDQPVMALSDEEIELGRQTFGLQNGDRVIVAGSTHPGEEEILLAGLCRLKDEFPEAKLILAPRDPARADAVKALAKASGLESACLAEIEAQANPGTVEVVVIDRIGILGRTYALGDVAFVGGSLVKAGGHNPLEPAMYRKPVLFGPDMTDFRLMARWLVEGRGAAVVADDNAFAAEAGRLLADAQAALEAGNNAYRVFSNHSGATRRIVNAISGVTGGPDA